MGFLRICLTVKTFFSSSLSLAYETAATTLF